MSKLTGEGQLEDLANAARDFGWKVSGMVLYHGLRFSGNGWAVKLNRMLGDDPLGESWNVLVFEPGEGIRAASLMWEKLTLRPALRLVRHLLGIDEMPDLTAKGIGPAGK